MESPGVSAMRGDVAVEMRYLDPRTRHNREAAKSLNVSGGARADSVGVVSSHDHSLDNPSPHGDSSRKLSVADRLPLLLDYDSA